MTTGMYWVLYNGKRIYFNSKEEKDAFIEEHGLKKRKSYAKKKPIKRTDKRKEHERNLPQDEQDLRKKIRKVNQRLYELERANLKSPAYLRAEQQIKSFYDKIGANIADKKRFSVDLSLLIDDKIKDDKARERNYKKNKEYLDNILDKLLSYETLTLKGARAVKKKELETIQSKYGDNLQEDDIKSLFQIRDYLKDLYGSLMLSSESLFESVTKQTQHNVDYYMKEIMQIVSLTKDWGKGETQSLIEEYLNVISKGLDVSAEVIVERKRRENLKRLEEQMKLYR